MRTFDETDGADLAERFACQLETALMAQALAETGSLPDERTKAVRSHRQPDEDEADHRADAKAREARDDQPCRAENDERVAETVRIYCANHARTIAPSRRNIQSFG